MIKTSKHQVTKMISENNFSLLSVQVQHALDIQALAHHENLEDERVYRVFPNNFKTSLRDFALCSK